MRLLWRRMTQGRRLTRCERARTCPAIPSHTIGGIALLALPQPYDFHASTERFRSYGADRANLWHEGGLHRVIAGREVRLEAAPGGVHVEPCDAAIAREASWLLGAPLDLDGFWAWAASDPVLAALREPLAGYRPPLVAGPWEMLVTLITAQQVSLHSAFAVRSRFIERFGVRHGEAWSFPSRERIAEAAEERDPRGRLLDPKGRVRDRARPR